MADNTVQGRYNLSDATETTMRFEQVRIPLYDDKGRAVDARSYARNLRKYLRDEPYEIESKLLTRGLGEVVLILGEK